MSAQQEKAGVMQTLLVLIQLALITVHVSQDLVAMELIVSVSSWVVCYKFYLFFIAWFLLWLVVLFITDMNECNTTDHGCHVNASCNNFDGSYFCKCNLGFNGNGTNCSGI